MTLSEKLTWLSQTRDGLLEYLRDPATTPVLSQCQQLRLVGEIARLEFHIRRISRMPDWAKQYAEDNATCIEVASGLNKNRQGVPLKKIRQAPHIKRTWTELR